MGHLKIYCDNCGSSWNVYHRDNFKGWEARTCPMCGASIDKQTWNNQVLRAFGEMEDTALELVKNRNQYHGTLFTVSYEPDVIYPNKSDRADEIQADLEEIRESIDRVNEVTTKLVNTLIIID